jgi:2,4-dienoyl-CoA reductase-like NADH-dependent reductase (Old Yellow Enzyme family)
LRNLLMSTAHDPAYTDEPMPKTRYRLCPVEKARGGIALTMIGGSPVIAPDGPQAFGNILIYNDECVWWRKELADNVHEEGGRGERAGLSRLPQTDRGLALARVIVAYADAVERVKPGGLDGVEFECYGHLIDQFCRRPPTSERTNMAGQWKTAGVSASRCSTR